MYPYTKPQSPTPFNSNSHPSHFCTKLWSKTLGAHFKFQGPTSFEYRFAKKKKIKNAGFAILDFALYKCSQNINQNH